MSCLPTEIVSLIFNFVECARTLGRLGCVCKSFHDLLFWDQKAWESFCVRFWREKEFDSKVNLWEVFGKFRGFDSQKDWKWLARSFANENKVAGHSFRLLGRPGNALISIGESVDGKLENSGMEIYLNGSAFYFGTFSKGKLHGKGEIQWESGGNFRGDWVDGHREGFGSYTWSNGDRYEGEFKLDGKKEGKGTFIYADGDRFQGFYLNDVREGWGRMEWNSSQYVFEGMFSRNEPVDTEGSLHPKIRKVLKRGKCTGNVTGNSTSFGQFFYESSNGQYCESCARSCVRGELGTVRRWSDGICCSCVGKDTCQRSPKRSRMADGQ